MITNDTFHSAFWYLFTRPLSCFWVDLIFVSSPRRTFISSPIGLLDPLRLKNFSWVSSQKMFEFFLIFFGDSSNPHQDSEIRCLETSSRKYLLQFIKRSSKVYQKNMSHQKTLKFNQSILYSQNYMQIRLLLWHADNITESSCSFQLFTVLIQTQKRYLSYLKWVF